jgi:hypothetical protein
MPKLKCVMNRTLLQVTIEDTVQADIKKARNTEINRALKPYTCLSRSGISDYG